MQTDESRTLYDAMCRLLPGGVNSPVRAFRSVDGTPRVLVRGEGPFVFDADGNRYIDLVGSWGPLIAGHAHPRVVQAVCEAARSGTTFGAPCPLELELARRVTERIGVADKVRFVNSGTEAVMTAVRLARGATGREKIVVFAGCYHGHSDALLAAGGSGLATLGLPATAGVTRGAVADTLVLALDSDEAADQAFSEHGAEIAAVLIEPVPANAGLLLQRPAFLQKLKQLCQQHGALLIFDEVISGFRVARGGASELYRIRPDLVTLGKVVGGGLPVGAVAGPAELMDRLAPDGPIYQAGTLSGNPLAMAAGAATLDLLDEDAYPRLEALGEKLEQGLQNGIAAAGLDAGVARMGSVLWICFAGAELPRTHRPDDAAAARYAAYHAHLLQAGVYAAPSAYEVGFLGLAHGETEVDQVIKAAAEAMKGVE